MTSDYVIQNMPPCASIDEARVAAVYLAIQEAANTALPDEACGFVLTDGRVVVVPNASTAPWVSFRIDPLVAKVWWDSGLITGVWHSHPNDPAVPSADDEAHALDDVDTLIYSVADEDLGWYRRGDDGGLYLVRMEGPD